MIDVANARKLALSLPEAEEQDHQGHPSFRVRGKIFATLWPDEQRVVVKLPVAELTALLGGDPKAFSVNAWSRQGWTNVHLQHVSASQLAALLALAWSTVAPRKLVSDQTTGKS
jgi:hypothetical protein